MVKMGDLVVERQYGDGDGEVIGGGGGEEKRRNEDGRMERPPEDDCCPICFGDFTLPCKTNCGHWFCAGCILQFWHYRAAFERCKCPICCRQISKLAPDESLLVQEEDEVVRALKSIQQYNCLYVGGVRGLFLKAQSSPLLMKRVFHNLMDPGRLKYNYYTMRFIGLALACLYHACGFDFIPTGTLGVRRLFDICAIFLVCLFFLIGLCREWFQRSRARRWSAIQH
ncbi:hypothetical protein Leryth_013978 [Lithospermum erythrorhizon]|nr:hypothetical protein Leryth_013978 [Lithospermum erythrorhizon]